MTAAPIHLAITDSGVGGLSACALVEKALRGVAGAPRHLTYFNVWPSEQGGYNDMPDIAARAAVFDRALRSMAAHGVQQIIVACNTLSIVYEHTAYRQAVECGVVGDSGRESAGGTKPSNADQVPPVLGIVDAGVELFRDALKRDARSCLALFGTKTTIESNVHRNRLVSTGVEASRIIPAGCHGLAKSIETEMDGPATLALIEECCARAAQTMRNADPGALHLGICCTHYTYLRDQMQAALQRHTGRQVNVLDPVDRLVNEVLARAGAGKERRQSPTEGRDAVDGEVTVKLVSKVKMSDTKRRLIADRIRTTSPVTAEAVLRYEHVPDLF